MLWQNLLDHGPSSAAKWEIFLWSQTCACDKFESISEKIDQLLNSGIFNLQCVYHKLLPHLLLHLRCPSGLPGWGIAWYINNTLIPELVVERGKTYTFHVYGGDNPAEDSNYHPFYITSSSSGGRLLNSETEREVSQQFLIQGATVMEPLSD